MLILVLITLLIPQMLATNTTTTTTTSTTTPQPVPQLNSGPRPLTRQQQKRVGILVGKLVRNHKDPKSNISRSGRMMKNKTVSIPNVGNNNASISSPFQFIGEEIQSVMAPDGNGVFHTETVQREVVYQNGVIVKDEVIHRKDGKLVYQGDTDKAESRLLEPPQRSNKTVKMILP